jgi:hypothetical protein
MLRIGFATQSAGPDGHLTNRHLRDDGPAACRDSLGLHHCARIIARAKKIPAKPTLQRHCNTGAIKNASYPAPRLRIAGPPRKATLQSGFGSPRPCWFFHTGRLPCAARKKSRNKPESHHHFNRGATEQWIPIACGPCHKKVCPLGNLKCMTRISTDKIYESRAEILGAM